METKNKTKEDKTMFKHSKTDELFNLVKTKEGVIICAGRFRVSSKKFKSYSDAEKYIASKPYEILINVSVLMVKLNTENEKENSSVKQETETK